MNNGHVKAMELVCPAGTLAALKIAVDAGADTVYCGFQDETNARNFPGLNFTVDELYEGIDYAHNKGSKVFVAINTYAQAGKVDLWHTAIRNVAEMKADALIMCDIGLLSWSMENYPDLHRHLSVQASSSNIDSINWYAETFGIARVVLPRVITIEQIKEITKHCAVDIETFVFGGLCVMAEGRCSLSSYVTSKSPNMDGVCSPASSVSYNEEGGELVSKLNGYTINRFRRGESAGYPTLCKGRFISGDDNVSYLFEDPISLDVASILPKFAEAGVTALKIEGRQRGKSYVQAVVRAFKLANKALAEGREIDVDLISFSEGQKTTKGAYSKSWR